MHCVLLIFILLGAGLLLWYWKAKNKTIASMIVSAGMAVLILVDLWSVDRRYLDDSNYVKEKAEESYKESVADKEIFKDTDESFRVFD